MDKINIFDGRKEFSNLSVSEFHEAMSVFVGINHFDRYFYGVSNLDNLGQVKFDLYSLSANQKILTSYLNLANKLSKEELPSMVHSFGKTFKKQFESTPSSVIVLPEVLGGVLKYTLALPKRAVESVLNPY